jgi:hypothetical protein
MVLDGTVNRSLVKDAIPDEAIEDAVDLRQQFRHLRRVLLMAFRHRGGDNAALSIHPNVQFLPAPRAGCIPVYGYIPVALSAGPMVICRYRTFE